MNNKQIKNFSTQVTSNDDISLINKNNKIVWHNINKHGCLQNSSDIIKNQAGVYIYQKTLGETRYYIGSSIKLLDRINGHKYYVASWSKKNYKGSPKFYYSVLKYGWHSFRLGVLEYIDLSNITNSKDKKRIILEKEQYYLDSVNPTLNISKTAGSILGLKLGAEFSEKQSLSRRGKKLTRSVQVAYVLSNKIRAIKNETRSKLSLRTNGVNIKVFDLSNNLIYEFPTITSAARHLGVVNSTISKVLSTGTLFNNLRFEYEVKDARIWVYNSDYKFVKVLDTANKTAEWANTSHTTIARYIKSGKLFKHKFYFSKTKL